MISTHCDYNFCSVFFTIGTHNIIVIDFNFLQSVHIVKNNKLYPYLYKWLVVAMAYT